jgi:hypothetical protein
MAVKSVIQRVGLFPQANRIQNQAFTRPATTFGQDALFF